MLSKKSDYEVGLPFACKTCDAFDPITGVEENPHDEIYLVYDDPKQDGVKMMNAETQKVSFFNWIVLLTMFRRID